MNYEKFTDEYFREMAKQEAPAGYVYLGTGGRVAQYQGDLYDYLHHKVFNKLKQNIDFVLLSNDKKRVMKKTIWGNDGTQHYALKKDQWEGLFGKPAAQKVVKTIVSPVQKLVDENIHFKGKNLDIDDEGTLIEEVYINEVSHAISYPIGEWKREELTPKYRKAADAAFKAGKAIAFATGSTGNDSYLFFLGDGFNVKESRPRVKINGHTGVNNGDTYTFGCAVIDKALLRNALKFLEGNENKDGKGNRLINGVKIGAGDFTLADLKNLYL